MKFFLRTIGPAMLGPVLASAAFADSIELGGRLAMDRSKMKKFGVCTILSIAALCALLSFSPRKAYADALLNMEITGVQGTSYANEDVYPYYGTANGKPVLLMCISYTADMNVGETWIAEKESIPDSSTFEEAAWLFNDANAAINATSPYSSYSPSYQIADQWAAWELFSPSAYSTAPSLAVTQMAAAVAAVANSSDPASFNQGFILYAPVPGTQNELGTPQFFLGYGDQTSTINTPDPYGGSPDSPAYGMLPEPSSLILLGTGMFGFAGAMYRRKRSA
jgi:PEP-CTERM motif